MVLQDAHAEKKIWNKDQNLSWICIAFSTTSTHELYSPYVRSGLSYLAVLLLAVEATKSCCLRASFDFIKSVTA